MLLTPSAVPRRVWTFASSRWICVLCGSRHHAAGVVIQLCSCNLNPMASTKVGAVHVALRQDQFQIFIGNPWTKPDRLLPWGFLDLLVFETLQQNLFHLLVMIMYCEGIPRLCIHHQMLFNTIDAIVSVELLFLPWREIAQT